MFKCQVSGLFSKPNDPAHRVVTQVRNKVYHRWDHKINDYVVVGHGKEIVKEILVSREVANSMLASGFEPQVVVEKE
jgi:hypothetical protein